MLNQIDINQSDIINEKMNLNKNKNISLLGNNLIKARANSDDEYNNIIQKQKDEVQRILNNHDDTYVNESSFDPTKSSPPNDFMRKLHNRLHKFNS